MEILIAIIVLSILILVHELGHFIFAKKFGMLVEEFGIGLPPRIWGKRRGSTIYSINLLPFGGFVRIYGETPLLKEPAETKAGLTAEILDKATAFYEKPAGIRFFVLVSGVLMNFMLGVLILSIILALGVPAYVGSNLKTPLSDIHVEILAASEASPAKNAGVLPGDRIVFLESNGEVMEIKKSKEVSDFAEKFKGKEITVGIRRNSSELSFKILSRKEPPQGEGAMGIAMADIGTLKYPWWQAPYEALKIGLKISWLILVALYDLLKNLFATGKIPEGVAGPIGIASITGEVFKLGIIRLLNFTALLSINLAVLNILPIPALDGGRVFFVVLEKLIGRPISRRLEATSHALGMAILLTLIMLISIHDIRRLL
ncbi:MAG: M50 family metallopeptidase [Candidatus Paceibacteria bacterium]